MIEGPQDFHWNRMYPGKRRNDDGRESACLRIQLQLSVILSAAAFLRLLKMENEQSGVGGGFRVSRLLDTRNETCLDFGYLLEYEIH